MNNPDDMLITGVDASGNKRTILVNADGSLVTTGGSGGGGGGGATAAEIKTAIETATNLDGVEGSLGGINGLTEGISDAIGTSSDLKVFDPNADATLMSLTKGQLGWLEDILNVLNTNNVLFNRVDEALGMSDNSVASSDTGTFSLIQLIKRLLSVKLPSTLGKKTSSTSFSVTLSNDEIVPVSGVTGNTANVLSSASSVTSFMSVVNVSNYENIIINTSTITNGTLTIQSSNDVNTPVWENIEGINSATGLVETSLSANSSYIVPVRFYAIRLLFTPAGTGSVGTVRFYYMRGNIDTISQAKSLIELKSILAKIPDLVDDKIPVTSINYLSGFNVVDRTTTGTFYEGLIPQSKSLVFQVTGDFTATNIITQSRIGSTFDYETIDIYSVKKRDWVSSVTEAGIYVVPNNAEAIKIELTAIFTGTVSFDYILRDDNLISYKQTLKQSYFDSSTVNVSSSSGATFYNPTSDLKKVIFTNNSTNTVFFDFTSSVSSSSYIFKLEPGDTFIDEGENINKDATYFAVANTATSAVRVARWF